MTSSRIITGLPDCINRRTKPVKGHATALQRLRIEMRVYRQGEQLTGKVALLIVVRGDARADSDARIKTIIDAGEGVLYADDKQVGPYSVVPWPGETGIEVQVFAWPAERRAWLAAIEAATMDWDAESRAMHDQRGAHR